MTLADFLLDRIAEDEDRARGDIEHFGGTDDPRDKWICKLAARVLAECAAKRRIVELHSGERAMCEDGYRDDVTHADALQIGSLNGVQYGGECDTLRALASVYADAPGFREEWAL